MTSHIPVVFVTAMVPQKTERPDDRGMMHTYLPKPLELPELLACIEEKLGLAQPSKMPGPVPQKPANRGALAADA
jgi:CheY-like chemotaxis protein